MSSNARASGIALVLLVPLALFASPQAWGTSFVRGDVDSNGSREITDAVRILGHLFLGDPSDLSCEDAADADDSGLLNITDAICLLTHLFLGGLEPPPPYRECGEDPTEDDLTCASFPRCGGRLITDPGGASVFIPSGAIDDSIEISVSTSLHGAELGSLVPVNGAAVCGPDGLTFAVPVKVTIPCAVPLEPGSEFPLMVWDADESLWEMTDFTATASADGLSYSGEVTHFSGFSAGPMGEGLFGDFDNEFRDCEANGGDIEGLINDFIARFLVRSDYRLGRRMLGTDGNCYTVAGIDFDITYVSACQGGGNHLGVTVGDAAGDKEIEFRLRTPAVPGMVDSIDFVITMFLDCEDPRIFLFANPSRLRLDGTVEVELAGCECAGEEMWPDGSKTVWFVLEGPGEIDPTRGSLAPGLVRAKTTYTATDFGKATVRASIYYDCSEMLGPKDVEKSVDIEVYSKAEISYSHNLTVKAGPCSQTEQVSGTVAVSISGEAIIGTGNVTTSGSGHCEECATTITGSALVLVEGAAAGDGSRQVHLDLTENWSKTITTQCPGGSSTTTVPTTVIQPLDFVWENGYTIEQPFTGAGGSGTYTWTLHITE